MAGTVPTWPPSPAAFELGPDEVHVWCASLQQSSAQVARFARTLSDDERDRAARTRHAPARHEFIVVRGLLRTLLADYLNVDSRRLAFCSGPTGKPALVEPASALPFYFNVSHSHELTLIAVTRRSLSPSSAVDGRSAPKCARASARRATAVRRPSVRADEGE